MIFCDNLILLLVFSTTLFVSVIAQKGKIEYPYEFQMFENFDLTKKVFLEEQKLIKKLREIQSTLKQSRDEIKNSLQSIQSLSYDVFDPVCALNALKRSALKLRPLKFSLKKRQKSHETDVQVMKEMTLEFPNLKDWDGAVRGMFMLYDTYEFNLTEANNGNLVFTDAFQRIRSFPSPEKLTAIDFADLGSHALHAINYYDRAVELFRETLNLYSETNSDAEFFQLYGPQIQELGRNAAKLNNKALTQKQVVVGANHKALLHLVDEKTLERKKKSPKGFQSKNLKIDLQSELGNEYFFRQICQKGKYFEDVRRPRPSKCGYYHHFDPYLILGPFKVEVISRDPYLVVFPHFFSETEIQWMLEYSIPRLSRHRHHDTNNEAAVHEYKLGKKTKIIHKTVQCWIQDVHFDTKDTRNFEMKELSFPNMFKMAKRMELASQLNVTARYSSTAFQTTNYGLGGTCDRHVDPYGYIEGKEIGENQQELKMSGDMIATFMGWLEDTEAGGGTAFINGKKEFLVTPRRGAVAFWHDLDAKGFRLGDTSHGGCPVLKGSKWILNKWIYYFNQFKKFPCGLDKEKKFENPKGYYK